jgi:hypothetical protein
MEMLILLIWFLISVGVPIALVVATYVGYVKSVPNSRFVVGWGIGLGVHVVTVGLSLYPIFIILYVGAHTTPVGNALPWQGRAIILGIEVLYPLLALGLVSFVAGRSRPWPLPEKKIP